MADDLRSTLARIDERTIAMKLAQDSHIDATNKILSDHETRIRGSESLGTKVTLIMGGVWAAVLVAFQVFLEKK